MSWTIWFGYKGMTNIKKCVFLRFILKWSKISLKLVQNWLKMIQKPLQNPIEILIEFWIDFSLILAPFWLPKLVQNDPKMIQKTYKRIYPKIIEKWSQNGPLNGGTDIAVGLLFELFFWTLSGLGFSRGQGPPQGPQMNDFGSENKPPKPPKRDSEAEKKKTNRHENTKGKCHTWVQALSR